MTNLLRVIHMLLCSTAIVLGFLTLSDLIRRHISVSGLIWFLRCTLASNVTVLFTNIHHLVPAQKVAMTTVYATGIVIIGWRAFHLRGKWREAFAFALVLVVYLDFLALSLQFPDPSALNLRCLQVFSFVAALIIGAIVAKRFAVATRPIPARVLIYRKPAAYR